MGRTLKDSFVNLIEYVTYRQEKDREFCVLCPYFLLSAYKKGAQPKPRTEKAQAPIAAKQTFDK